MGVSIQSQDAVQRITHLQALFNGYIEHLQNERAVERIIEVLGLLFERPIVTVRQVESALEVPYRSASRYVEKLVQLGILREITGKARNRIFRADEIFSEIEDSIGNQ